MQRRKFYILSGVFASALIVAIVLVAVVRPVQAASGYTIAPLGFHNGATAKWVAGAGEHGGQGLVLEKTVPTSVVAAGVAQINGVEQQHLDVDSLVLSFDHQNGTYCGAGAPRFNVDVTLPDGSSERIFLGCYYGTQSPAPVAGWTTYTFNVQNPGQCFCVLPPAGSVVTGIEIIQDEQGSATLDHITIDGKVIDSRGNTDSQ
ncbi:MAG TPA: hypothetical protein VFU63_04860 [Ktedonobacterales bacterium]|nr:hypothetical protein [Ktedonobacterales bacterium]